METRYKEGRGDRGGNTPELGEITGSASEWGQHEGIGGKSDSEVRRKGRATVAGRRQLRDGPEGSHINRVGAYGGLARTWKFPCRRYEARGKSAGGRGRYEYERDGRQLWPFEVCPPLRDTVSERHAGEDNACHAFSPASGEAQDQEPHSAPGGHQINTSFSA